MEFHCQGFFFFFPKLVFLFICVFLSLFVYQAARSGHGNALFPTRSHILTQHSHFDHLWEAEPVREETPLTFHSFIPFGMPPLARARAQEE